MTFSLCDNYDIIAVRLQTSDPGLLTQDRESDAGLTAEAAEDAEK